MTFRQWVIRELAAARKREKRAKKRHREAVKLYGGDGDDQNFYDLLTTAEARVILECVLYAHRELAKSRGEVGK